jgi:hypothetical protein
MQMSTDHGFAFLCMPKCASTSIERAINPLCNIIFSGHPGIKHINARNFSKSILAVHRELVPGRKVESFCLMREPLAWIESWYRYRSRNELKNPNNPNHKHYTGNISYSEFIEEFITQGKRKPFANLNSQYEFLRSESGQAGVDYIFPMDQLDLVVDFLFEKTGQKLDIPLENISPKKRMILESDLEDKLRVYFQKDLLIYDFIKKHGTYNNALHSSSLSVLLQDYS